MKACNTFSWYFLIYWGIQVALSLFFQTVYFSDFWIQSRHCNPHHYIVPNLITLKEAWYVPHSLLHLPLHQNSSCKWTHRARVFRCLLLLLHRFVCLATSFYLTINSVPSYTYTSLFYDRLAFYCGDILPLLICFSIVRCMLRYHFLAMMSNASMNAAVHLFLWKHVCVIFECIAIRTIGS